MRMVFPYRCYKCKNETKVSHDGSNPGISCPQCGAVAKYWNGQLDIENYKRPEPPDFCVVIFSYYPKFLTKMISRLEQFSMGVSADVYFVHNVFEVGSINRANPRSQEEIDEIRKLVRDCKLKNKTLIERNNTGEDLGSYQYIFDLLKHKYKYFFFANENVPPKCDNWLKPFLEMYKNNDLVVATGPFVLKKENPWIHDAYGRGEGKDAWGEDGDKFRYIIPTSYWSLRSSFGIDVLVWPPALHRGQSKAQEMELVYPQAHDNGYFIAQVGNGLDLMNEKRGEENFPPSEGIGEGMIV